jgi:hypothetical protein
LLKWLVGKGFMTRWHCPPIPSGEVAIYKPDPEVYRLAIEASVFRAHGIWWMTLRPTWRLSKWPEVLLVTGGDDHTNEVASRVAEAFHSTADPTRPPQICGPQRVRRPHLPRRLPLRLLGLLHGPHRIAGVQRSATR